MSFNTFSKSDVLSPVKGKAAPPRVMPTAADMEKLKILEEELNDFEAEIAMRGYGIDLRVEDYRCFAVRVGKQNPRIRIYIQKSDWGPLEAKCLAAIRWQEKLRIWNKLKEQLERS